MCETEGWREYKKYLIKEYKKTGDKYYRKSARKVDKIIKELLKKGEGNDNHSK